MRIFYAIGIVLFWSCPALAFNHSLVFSGAVESAPPSGNVVISEDFTSYGTSSAHLGGTSSAPWTTLSGSDSSIDTTNDAFDFASGSGSVTIWEYQQLDSINQWVCVTTETAVFYKGVYLRSTNNSSEYAYGVRNESGNTIARYCTGHSCTDIGTATSQLFAANDGDTSCVAVSGTGTDTIFELWDFGGTPPTYPAAGVDPQTIWGAPDATITDDPGQEANTGLYVGEYNGGSLGGSDSEFHAGSW